MKNFFTKKLFIIGIIILAVIGYFVFRSKKVDITTIQTDLVKKQDLKQTVLSTGEVNSETDLSLSFKASGVVNKVGVKVGSKAKQGDVLASLESKDVAARLTQARGALAQAKANYQKVISGASGEDVAVSQVALDNAKISLENTKKQQQVLVENAFKTLMTSGVSAVPATNNSSSATATVSGTYSSPEQGQYKVSVYASGSGWKFQVSGLENSDGLISATPQPLGNRGLFIQFSSTSGLVGNEVWTVTIPNTQSSLYITNYNSYQSALETQKSAVATAENAIASAQAALDLKKAKARPADLEVVEAQILTAQGQVEAAGAELENTIIRAPASGTVTKVDIKVGELATALKQIIVIQDVTNLHVESDISEANISSVKVGQTVNIDFDSLGSDRKFTAMVQKVDPASTLVSGVVKYKITVGLEKIDEIKPGMTANLSIVTGEKTAVLVVPLRSVVSRDGKKYVKVVTDSKTKKYEEKEVVTGMEGDGGLVEIVSGLTEGQEVVVYIKPK